MDILLEIFVEMFPNIPPHHIKSIVETYSNNLKDRLLEDIFEAILNKLFDITKKQDSVKEPKPCDINVEVKEKNTFLNKISKTLSFKKRKYNRLLTYRLD